VDKRKVIYYEDELNDEFSLAQITPITIDKNYVYDHGTAWKRFTRFFWYRIVATPIAYVYAKLTFHHKVIGREKLVAHKDTGYFLYGNHTQDIGDAVQLQQTGKHQHRKENKQTFEQICRFGALHQRQDFVDDKDHDGNIQNIRNLDQHQVSPQHTGEFHQFQFHFDIIIPFASGIAIIFFISSPG
jgi:hypothetical protein